MNAPASQPSHPPPIHRSKTLWLGILILTFLAWAWHDSTCSYTVIRHQAYSISHAGSGICIADWKSYYRHPLWVRQQIPDYREEWSRLSIPAPEFFRSIGHFRQLADYVRGPGSSDFRPRNSAASHFINMISTQMRGAWGLFIPHWLIILTFLIPWLALLLWRHRHTRHPKP